MPVGDEYVEQPVVIVVEKARAPAQKRDRQCCDSSAKADVGKRRVAFIPVKRVVIVGKIRDVEIDFTIAVVVAHCDSHGGLLMPIVVQGKSREIADVFERPVVLVPVEILWYGIVRDRQIDPPVVIHVHKHG